METEQLDATISANNDKIQDKVTKIKNLADLQRLKLEKLMKNPDKPVIIPERPKPKNVPSVPDFVRNVMGSSAGAGSGEFHVYRHLRRKEYARQKCIQELSVREKLELEYQQKLENNQRIAEEKTAKKRAKRLKKKAKRKNKKFKPDQTKLVEEKVESEESNNSVDSDDSINKSNEFVQNKNIDISKKSETVTPLDEEKNEADKGDTL